MSLTRSQRIRGGLFGALVGDALGVPVEFKGREIRDADPVTGMRAFGTWHQPAGTWSDDGALLLCTADGLARGLDLAGIGGLFVRWRRDGLWTARGDVFDIGNTTSVAIARLERGVPPLQAGPREPASNGNGSLMRILPVAWQDAAAGDAVLAERARELSCLTHGHARSQLACAFYCLLAAGLLRGESPAAAFAQAQRSFIPMLETHSEERANFARLLRPDFAGTGRGEISSEGYVLHTLEASVWCLLQHSDYASAVLAAVNLGGDTDTTGCVTGGLAGLHHGFEAIPSEWVEALPQREKLEALLAAIP